MTHWFMNPAVENCSNTIWMRASTNWHTAKTKIGQTCRHFSNRRTKTKSLDRHFLACMPQRAQHKSVRLTAPAGACTCTGECSHCGGLAHRRELDRHPARPLATLSRQACLPPCYVLTPSLPAPSRQVCLPCPALSYPPARPSSRAARLWQCLPPTKAPLAWGRTAARALGLGSCAWGPGWLLLSMPSTRLGPGPARPGQVAGNVTPLREPPAAGPVTAWLSD